MSKLNKTISTKNNSSIHQNFMGGNSWDVSNPFIKLRMIAASSFFGEPQYYKEDGSINLKYEYTNIDQETFKYVENFLGKCFIAPSPSDCDSCSWQETIEHVIDDCLNIDVEKTLHIASMLRNEDLIRSTPQVILVRAAMHEKCKGTGLIGKYINKICIRGDEPAAGLSYLISKYGKKTPIPNSLKKGWKRVLESFDDYVISKYKMENNFVKTRDVVNLVHAYSNSIHKLMNGKAKQEKTWNSIVSNANKEEKTKKEIWMDALKGMPHMALLRNLRNLIENSVDENLFLDKLYKGVEGGKQLPFRYYSAYKKVNQIASPNVLNILEKCLDKSFIHAPHFAGKTMVLSDNSGSAWGTLTSELGTMHVAEIGNLMGVMTGKMSDEAQIGIFGDRLEILDIKKDEKVFPFLDKLTTIGHGIGGGTENGIWLFFDKAIKEKLHYDNIFIYSDMQCGHGGLYGINGKHNYKDFIWKPKESSWGNDYIDVPKLINHYRQTVNPNVMVYLIQTAGYKDTLVPEYYDKTFILGGWSANIPLFAAKMTDLYLELTK